MKLVINGNEELKDMYTQHPFHAVGKIRVLLDEDDSPVAYKHEAIGMVETTYRVTPGEFLNVMETHSNDEMYFLQPQMQPDTLIPIDAETFSQCVQAFADTATYGFDPVVWYPVGTRELVELG